MNHYESTKATIETRIAELQKNLIEVNDFIMADLTKPAKHTCSISASFENYTEENYYHNKTWNIKVDLFSTIMEKTINDNPIMRMMLFTSYRSVLTQEVRRQKLLLENHRLEAINYLNQK